MKEILKNIEIGQIIGLYHFEDSCFTVGKVLKISSKHLFVLSYDINFKKDGIKIFLIDSIKRIILKSNYIENLKKKEKKNFILKDNIEDLFQEIITKRVKISIELADKSIEDIYLIEKTENYFKFCTLDDNENILSMEIIEKDYLKRIKITNFSENEEYRNFKIISTTDNNEYMGYNLSYSENYLIFYEKMEFYDISKINIIPKNRIEEISEINVKLNIEKTDFFNLIDLDKDLEISKILKKCFESRFLIFIDNENFFETKVGVIIELGDEKLKIKEIDKYGNFIKISEVYFDEIQLLAVKNYKFLEEDYEEKF